MPKRDFPPIHPGEILKEEFLEPAGLSQLRLSTDLGIPYVRINEIVKGKRGITAATALLLARFFGNSPQFWLNLQSRYDLLCAEEKMEENLKRVRPMARTGC